MVKRTEGMREVVRPLGTLLEAHRSSRAAATGARSWQAIHRQWGDSQHSIAAPSAHFLAWIELFTIFLVHIYIFDDHLLL